MEGRGRGEGGLFFLFYKFLEFNLITVIGLKLNLANCERWQEPVTSQTNHSPEKISSRSNPYSVDKAGHKCKIS